MGKLVLRARLGPLRIPEERSGGEFEAVAVSARRFCEGIEAMGGGGAVPVGRGVGFWKLPFCFGAEILVERR